MRWAWYIRVKRHQHFLLDDTLSTTATTFSCRWHIRPHPHPSPQRRPSIHPRHRTGYKKSAVFSQWQRQLQLQQYEPACYRTAEASLRGTMTAGEARCVCGKHVHVHAPTLPTLRAQLRLLPTLPARTLSRPLRPVRNHGTAELRQHLRQAVGLVALSARVRSTPTQSRHGPRGRIKMVVGVHAWLLPHRTSGDAEAVVRLLSTVLWNLEQQDTPNVRAKRAACV